MRRRLIRLIYHLLKFLIGMIAYMDSRLYMRLFNILLRGVGLKMNGVPRFIAKSVRFDDFDQITVGDRLVVSMNVTFLTHDYSYTTGLISIGKKPGTDIGLLRPIKVGNNVFIGMNAILLPGATIGDNVIVGAGSVVRGAIPDNSVVLGSPAVVVSDIQSYTAKLEGYDARKVVDKK